MILQAKVKRVYCRTSRFRQALFLEVVGVLSMRRRATKLLLDRRPRGAGENHRAHSQKKKIMFFLESTEDRVVAMN